MRDGAQVPVPTVTSARDRYVRVTVSTRGACLGVLHEQTLLPLLTLPYTVARVRHPPPVPGLNRFIYPHPLTATTPPPTA